MLLRNIDSNNIHRATPEDDILHGHSSANVKSDETTYVLQSLLHVRRYTSDIRLEK
jgi:hypothetical protein